MLNTAHISCLFFPCPEAVTALKCSIDQSRVLVVLTQFFLVRMSQYGCVFQLQRCSVSSGTALFCQLWQQHCLWTLQTWERLLQK